MLYLVRIEEGHEHRVQVDHHEYTQQHEEDACEAEVEPFVFDLILHSEE